MRSSRRPCRLCAASEPWLSFRIGLHQTRKDTALVAFVPGSGIFVDKLAELSYIVRHENEYPHNPT